MAENDTGEFELGRAAETPVSLSQALLAPLDAIFMAQVHAARSFLNVLLQIGYPHQPLDKDGKPSIPEGTPFTQNFDFEFEKDGKTEKRRLSIPSLALLPLSPLSVETASFKLEMRAEKITRQAQVQEKRAALDKRTPFSETKRPWFLISEPISIQGTLASTVPHESSAAEGSTIQIEIKIGRVPMPAGLDRLLTALSETLNPSSAVLPEKKN